MRGRRWDLPLEMKLSPLRETEQNGGDKSGVDVAVVVVTHVLNQSYFREVISE